MRVCVIGTGVSGLPAIKECRDAGLEVVAYERTTDIGGLWNYRPHLKEGGTVMRSTVVNTSKEMMAYSDFPPPKHYPNFMHHSLVKKYLESYATKFYLYQHIRFNTTVERLTRVGGQWEVATDSGDKDLFDFAMLCTGHHSFPLYPNIKGMETFKGKVLHAHEYRDYIGFEDRNVFIIGIGNSSLDIAVELAKISKTVTISTRRGTWVFNRVSQGGMPYDLKFMTRLYDFVNDTIPWTVANDFMEHRLQQRMDHDLYGLRPSHRFFQQHPTLNDALPNLLASGHIVITENVDMVEQSGVVVEGGRYFPADIIVCATGYTFGFPYLNPEAIIPIKNQRPELYKYVFPLESPTLAVIGLIQPIGSVAPISEMQARWVASVFTGRTKLPSKIEMVKNVKQKQRLMKRRYYESSKHTVQVDYMKYMDELAELVGCRPDLKLHLTEPHFLLRLLIGPNAPYVYRLNGPGSWKGAKDALLTLPDRVKAPLKNRQCRTRRHKKRGKIDEYFRYASLKWLAGWWCLILIAGLCAFCSTPNAMSPISFFVYNLLYFVLFSFMLLWFDLQYDMSTIF